MIEQIRAQEEGVAQIEVRDEVAEQDDFVQFDGLEDANVFLDTSAFVNPFRTSLN